LAKDYENLNRTAIAFIRLASISLMLQPVHPGEGFADLAEFNSALARHVFWYLKRCAVRDDIAHVRALHYLEAGGESQVLNCGYGHGFSVKEILEKIQEVAGRKLDIRKGPRRPGDPPELVADPSQIQKILGWQPIHNDLLEIIDSALRWEKKLVHLT
jgi:nucleoside-diphosphate-sugar epimerase